MTTRNATFCSGLYFSVWLKWNVWLLLFDRVLLLWRQVWYDVETHESYQGQQEVNIAAPLSKVSAWLLCLCLLSVRDGDLKWELSLHDTTVMSRSLYMTMTCIATYSFTWWWPVLWLTVFTWQWPVIWLQVFTWQWPVLWLSLYMMMTCVVTYSLYMTMTCVVIYSLYMTVTSVWAHM